MSFPIRNWRNSSLALLALLVFAGQARGASDAPTELIPRAEGADEISVTPLAPVGIGGIGTLKPEEHPFPAEMWRGSRYDQVKEGLQRLQPSTSPSLQSLAHRLLLSDAESPSLEAGSGAELIQLRIDRLQALGDFTGALALIAVLPHGVMNETIERAAVEIYFTLNDIDSACNEAQTAISRYQDVWWDRTLIACHALHGDSAQANLGLSLLAERQVPGAPRFDALIAALDGSSKALDKVLGDKMAGASPLEMTLLAAAKHKLPGDVLPEGSLAQAREWAGDPRVPPLRRLAAAEKAVAFGALPPTELAILYRESGVTPEQIKTALTKGEAPPGSKGRAILYAAAQSTLDPALRAKVLAAFLARARGEGDFPVAARLAAPLIDAITPTADPPGFAADATRALLIDGKIDFAHAWAAAAGDTAVALRPLLEPARTDAVEDPAKGAGVGNVVLASLLRGTMMNHLTTDPITLTGMLTGLRDAGLTEEAHAIEIEAAVAAGK